MNATFSRVAGFRVSECVVLYQCICQSHHFCRNLLIAMSNREANGWEIQQRQGAQRSTMAANLLNRSEAHVQYSCPGCGSENTQRLSTVYMAGVSQFSAVTNGFGWAGGFAGGSGRTEGTCQTGLSQISAPPYKRCYRGGLLLLFFGPVIGALPFAIMEHLNGKAHVHEILAGISVILLEICAIFLLVRAALYNRTTWPTRIREWQITWICLRCARVFLPVANRRE